MNARNGELSKVKGYVEADANSINATDSKGYTPLHWAADWGQVDVVKYLLSKGANPQARGKSGWTPLQASEAEGHMTVSRLLREAMAKRTQQPAAQPVVSQPVVQTPVVQTPVVQTPVVQTPTVQQVPIQTYPTVQTMPTAPVMQPVVQQRPAVVQQPVQQQPVQQQPAGSPVQGARTTVEDTRATVEQVNALIEMFGKKKAN